jgi:predicted metal-dependent enzyme (double-stranded beta helix superfamily)
MTFEVEGFVAACRKALGDPNPQGAVRDLLDRTLAEPGRVVRGLGEPRRGEIQKLHVSSDLTILNVIWAPYMTIMPHNHRMWAVIGVYTGREDNIFWRRLEPGPVPGIEARGARSLGTRDVAPLGHDVIHSVNNPIPRLTGALHVYGGDFFAAPRSEWDPETLEERRYDVEKNLRLFEAANARQAGERGR